MQVHRTATARCSSWAGAAPAAAVGRGRAASAPGARHAPAALPLDAASSAWELVAAGADRLAVDVRQELVREGVLHTPIGASLQCMTKYSSFDIADAPPVFAAPAPPAAPEPARAPQLAAADAQIVSRAVCLATPVEPVEEGSRGGAAAARAAIARLRAPDVHARVAAAVEAEDAFCHIELWQRRVALLECGEMAAEYLKKAAATRRGRRLALVRAVREARDGARSLFNAVRPGGGEDAVA
ncbi:MAG: hypothetical protein J3K34DRAFT_458028 [Monoraphidium minutum]|nr:MAG: hypothetical protein J3K34DRAFT_458028 [Monoraphidium minutum]